MFIAITLHLLAAIIWVGGMFFAYMVLRPCAAHLLPPPARITLWHGCFERFFPWVWGCIATLAATGYWMVFNLYGDFGASSWQVKTMHLSGLMMIALFLYLYLSPYQRFKLQTAKQSYPEAGQSLAKIRTIIGINLIAGVFTSIIAAAGKGI